MRARLGSFTNPWGAASNTLFAMPKLDFVGDKLHDWFGFGKKKTGDLAEGEKLHKQLFPGISKAEERDMMMGSMTKEGKYTPSIVDKTLGSISQKYESGKGGAGRGRGAGCRGVRCQYPLGWSACHYRHADGCDRA